MIKEKISAVLLRIEELGLQAGTECERELENSLHELQVIQTKIADIYERKQKLREERKQLELELRTLMIYYIENEYQNTLSCDDNSLQKEVCG